MLTYATWNLNWWWLSSVCSWYNWVFSDSCKYDAIYNVWNQYFWWFLENIKYYTFDKAMTIQVQDWIFMVITLILFLSFIVGFIFVSRK